MDTAINSKTGEIINAISLETNPSYLSYKEEKWYADPNNIESYDKEKIKDITKIEVRYRKGNDKVINYNGTEYVIAPCFFILNKEELGINTIPESKEHKMTKNWIYNRIKNKNLYFMYSTVKRPFEYTNGFNIQSLNVDYNKVGIEIVVLNNKTQKADVIIPLKNKDTFLGNGIVIEIQFSKQWISTENKRSYEWAFKGYSICWLHFEDFKEISESMIELKEDKLLLEPLDKLLYQFNKENKEDLRSFTQNLARMIDIKMGELNYPFIIGKCDVCGKGYMAKKKVRKGENVGNLFYGCSNFPECRHCIWINDTN